MTIAGFTFTKVGFKSRMRGQCFGFTFGFTRKKFHGNPKCHGSYRFDWTKKSIRVKLVSTFWLSSV